MKLPAFEYKISLGQNFLYDAELLDRLVAAAGIKPGDQVLEIGAGRGDLTSALVRAGARVTAYEIDLRLEQVLKDRFQNEEGVRLIMEDAASADFLEVMGQTPFYVVSNLPYYLTTPLLQKLLCLRAPLLGIHVMVQAEAARRVLAQPGTPEYGPLAILAQYYTLPQIAEVVPASAFTPPPKVDSAFLVMPKRPEPAAAVQNEVLFFRVVQAAFVLRRKTLVNNLVHGFGITRMQAQTLLEKAGLPIQIRGEKLSLVDFALLSNLMTEENTKM